ncbi:MAG TPA: hypothetical protein DEG96_08015 [Candidatus Atribacteria bacterium]|nr:hypothetical protein [Candidatus Atribacteria bacterium]
MQGYFKFLHINENKKIWKSQKGMALLSVLIFAFVLVSIVIAMLVMAQNDTKLSTLQRDSTKAFYLAESGIEETLWKLNNDEITILNDYSFTDSYNYGTETEYYNVELNIVPEADPRRGENDEIKDWVLIESTGVVKGNGEDVTGKRTIEVVAHFTITQRTSVLYEKAILTNHMITFQGKPGATITGGDIHSNYGIDVKGPFTFYGIATTSGVPDDYPNTPYSALNKLDGTDNGDFSGPLNWPAMDIPPVPYDELKQMAIANNTYYPNGFDTNIEGRGHHDFTGVVYVEGDVIFRNDDSLTITDGALIVAKNNPDDPNDTSGTMEFKNGSNLTILRNDPVPEGAYPGPIALAAQGDILLHASSSSINGVVQSGGYYNEEGELLPGGMVDFRNDSVVTGAVVAEEVWMHNNTTINYDGDFMEDFQTVTTIGNERYVKVSWREI